MKSITQKLKNFLGGPPPLDESHSERCWSLPVADPRFPEERFLQVPLRILTQNYALCGSIGSGKTLVMKLLMQDVFQGIEPDSAERLVIFDAKRDMRPYLAALKQEKKLRVPYHLLNPFDKDGCAWNMAADIRTHAHAMSLAHAFVPDNPKEAQPFFTGAAQLLLCRIVEGLIERAKRNWTLRDLIQATAVPKNTKRLLEQTEAGQSFLDEFDENERLFSEIRMSLRVRMERFSLVAALWEKVAPERRLGLEQWLTGASTTSILVLPNRPSTEPAIRPINELILHRLCQLILDQPEAPKVRSMPVPRFWFFLDELRTLGRVETLPVALRTGRSKGLCCILGFQGVDGLRDLFGNDAAGEILGQCSSWTIFRQSSVESARYLEQHIGQKREYETQYSQTTSSRDSSSTVSTSLQDRPALLASDFLSAPMSTEERGVWMVHDIPLGGTLVPNRVGKNGFYLPRLKDLVNRLVDNKVGEPEERTRDESDEALIPWDDADLVRLNLRSKAKAAPPVKPTKQKPSFLTGITRVPLLSL